MDFKKNAKYVHFYGLLVIIVNYVAREYTGYSLSNWILFAIKVLFWGSGIVLFFYYAKPFKKRAIYFGLYFFMPLIAIISYIVYLSYGVILVSLFFYWLSPDEVESKQDNTIIYSQFSGFMGGSSRFVIRENYYLVEKDLGHFNIPYETRDALKKIDIVDDQSVILYYTQSDKYDKVQIVSDTINLVH